MSIVNIFQGDTHKKIVADEPMQLESFLKEIGLQLDMPCGGHHTCGKCKIKVTGELSPMGLDERKHLTPEECENHIRLACFVEVLGDIELYLEKKETAILSLVMLEHVDRKHKGFGIAVDIGTTTIAMQLYDLASGHLLGESLRTNNQGIYGADVISRIQSDQERGDDALQTCLRHQLREMSAMCMKQAGLDKIDRVIITGHTVMLHFYEGLETKNIAMAPFTVSSLFGKESDHRIGQGRTYLPSCISAYVGADITCSILASGMIQKPDCIEILADLGTNGELVLNHFGKLYCTSTAAGPAFEGANLTYGMRADSGAISRVIIEQGQISIEVIGDKYPIGLCGSGVIDAVSVMVDLGIIDDTGRLDKNYKGLGHVSRREGELAWKIPNTQIYITQKDIREIQLAKSAINAGIQVLLEEAGLRVSDVQTFYIAGGFGYHMDGRSGANIGLYPEGLEKCIKVIGNGALTGAVMLLLDDAQMTNEKAIVSQSTEVILSGKKTFSDYYIDGMLFNEE